MIYMLLGHKGGGILGSDLSACWIGANINELKPDPSERFNNDSRE
jgi:hypothetical protein